MIDLTQMTINVEPIFLLTGVLIVALASIWAVKRVVVWFRS